MKIFDVAVQTITVNGRAREQYNNIKELAESISKYGLLHPITVDEGKHLIAGARRLKAVQELGWAEIPAQVYASLSADEKLEIELEENLRREDLSQPEISKIRLQLAETAAKIINDESLLTVSNDSAKKEGGQEKVDSEEKVATRINVSRQTLNLDKRYLAALKRYPALESIGSGMIEIVTIAKNLNKLPAAERESALEKLIGFDPDTTTTLAEKPPMGAPRPPASAAVRWAKVALELSKLFTSFNAAGGAQELAANWSAVERAKYIKHLNALINELTTIKREMKDMK